MIYALFSLSAAVIYSSFGALSFDFPLFTDRLASSVVCLLIGASITSLYCLWLRQKARWGLIVTVSLLMTLASSATFSAVRQEVVFLVLPSLAYLPGCALAGAILLYHFTKKDEEEADVPPAIEDARNDLVGSSRSPQEP